MSRINVGKLELDPAKNPAVLDTTTWDPARAWSQVTKAGPTFWEQVSRASGSDDYPSGPCVAHAGSYASSRGDSILLVSLEDGQDLFVQIGERTDSSVLGQPAGVMGLSGAKKVAGFPTDMATLQKYLKHINPEKAPRALGSVPRLGIGDRHTTSIWPAAYRAMERGGFAANAIQNSLRELFLLSDLKEALPAKENYLFSFGTIAEGHTGSTFEGLLHAGTIAALKEPTYPRYGADADHIQVKRGPSGLDRAKRVVDAARYYTFFTLDVSDILDYGALNTQSDAEARELLDRTIADGALRKDVLAYYARHRKIGGESFAFSEGDIGRFVGKYWNALSAVEELISHIKGLKGDVPFDIELSIDENPAEVATCDCITSPAEMVFLAVELQRRHMPVTHIAPNFGVEKGTDYRCPDGREGLEERIGLISRVASEYNLMLDCHSGDDLSKETRQVFGRATGGRTNFKISPQQQIMFAETLYEVQPQLFQFWWDDVYKFVSGEAAKGSSFAQQCLEEYKANPNANPNQRLFHYYCFVSVGRRDEDGRFVNRERLYELTPEFLAEYGRRLEAWLLEIAEDLYGSY